MKQPSLRTRSLVHVIYVLVANNASVYIGLGLCVHVCSTCPATKTFHFPRSLLKQADMPWHVRMHHSHAVYAEHAAETQLDMQTQSACPRHQPHTSTNTPMHVECLSRPTHACVHAYVRACLHHCIPARMHVHNHASTHPSTHSLRLSSSAAPCPRGHTGTSQPPCVLLHWLT